MKKIEFKEVSSKQLNGAGHWIAGGLGVAGGLGLGILLT